MKIEIELDEELLDDVIVDSLKDHYNMIKNTKSSRVIASSSNEELLKALELVIEYHLTFDDFQKWKDSISNN